MFTVHWQPTFSLQCLSHQMSSLHCTNSITFVSPSRGFKLFVLLLHGTFDRAQYVALIQGRYFDAYYIPASRPVEHSGLITVR